MNSLSCFVLVVTAALSQCNITTDVQAQASRAERSPRSTRLSQTTTEDPSSAFEEFTIVNGTFPMVGWTDSEKLFMKQTNNTKHEPMDVHGNRIVGGNYTIISKFPYQLQLSIDNIARCGASIISNLWAITAAHCMSNDGRLYPKELLSLRCGSTIRNMGGRVHRLARSVVHPRYSATDKFNRENDIALLKVKKPFSISFLVQPISLPPADLTVTEGTMAVVSGWGHTTNNGTPSNILQQVQIPIANHSKCADVYYPVNVITRRMLCAGQFERDSCQGDSGGPLAYNKKLIGIVSFGNGCGLANYPGVYTKVSQYRSFIREYTGL